MYPKLKAFINKRFIEDKVFLSSYEERLIFSGESSKVISKIVSEMNGENSLEHLAQKFDLRVDTIQDLVNYLESKDYLYLSEDPINDGKVNNNLLNKVIADYFNIDNSNIEIILNKRIGIISSPCSSRLREYMIEMGFVRIDVIPISDITDNMDLVIVNKEDHDKLNKVNSICLDKKVPWLKYSTGVNKITIGPIFETPTTACYTCYINRKVSNDNFYNPKNLDRKDYYLTFPSTEFICFGLIINEIYKYFLSKDYCMIVAKQYEIDLDTLDSYLRPVYKMPLCSSCSNQNRQSMYAESVVGGEKSE
ncbi:hypothetical protein KGF86_06420 [Ornithinibacillus massiliensis]|uniref:TOMM leader peptide-binding protein n=1 Tax=Ornithinibacillus massiliensis TaxID=1944633 RepID=A0ABS5MBY4_9BACI|nr:hypothetical protein [Ornithinibacillus massiliensis]MBS3679842.1 hypothetical protein [Ornithinibacillus massiliensis]